MIVVLMGVSGSGKTTIGSLLAKRTGAVFADADDFHTAESKAKMAEGFALTDEDREPWLERLNLMLQQWAQRGDRGVLACSALKAIYRERLECGITPGTVHFVLLDGSRELIASRLAKRRHEYMNPALLDSQLRTLEPPDNAYSVVNDRAPGVIVSEILTHIGVVLA